MLKIKEVIKKKGYTVTSLANKIGMAQVSLSRIINGNPTVDTLSKIANALDVDIRELFNPTKDSGSEHQLYVKDEQGNLKRYGVLKLDE